MHRAKLGRTLLVIGLVGRELYGSGYINGTIIGIPMGTQVPMTAMPQRIAISHMFGALAAIALLAWFTTARTGVIRAAA